MIINSQLKNQLPHFPSNHHPPQQSIQRINSRVHKKNQCPVIPKMDKELPMNLRMEL